MTTINIYDHQSLYSVYNTQYDYLPVAQIDKSGRIHAGARKAENVLKYGYGKEDAYQCLNPTIPKTNKYGKTYFRRCKNNVQSLKYCYMDIDVPKTGEMSGIDSHSLYSIMVMDGVFETLPKPTGILYSGTGLWLLWQVNAHINAAPKWKKVQSRLYEILRDYGADSTCVTDYARLCRIPGSVNSKNGKTVIYDPSPMPFEYTLDELLYMLPETEYEKKKAAIKDNKQKRAFKIDTKNPVFMLRARDIAVLLKTTYRGTTEGMREVMLFLYRYNLRLAGCSQEQALALTEELNNSIKYPLNNKELIQATASADRAVDKKNGLYRYTNKRLIDELKITEDEQRRLKTIRAAQENTEERKKRKNKEYVARVHKKGLRTKSEHKSDTIKAINELKRNGKSNAEIMRALSIPKSTFYRYIKNEKCIENKAGQALCKQSQNFTSLIKKETRRVSVIDAGNAQDTSHTLGRPLSGAVAVTGGCRGLRGAAVVRSVIHPRALLCLSINLCDDAPPTIRGSG